MIEVNLVWESIMKSLSLLSGYIYLILGIITGIASNGFLNTTEGFTKLNPTIFCVISIIVCLFCLSKAMTIIPVSYSYATYGALTITAVTLFGIFKYNHCLLYTSPSPRD